MDKQAIINRLRDLINLRPMLEPGNYEDLASYRRESREITRDLHIARALIREVELSSIPAEAIILELQGSRIDLSDTHAEYTPCQYWPTEYRGLRPHHARASVARLLRNALWHYWRDELGSSDAVRARARRTFRSRAIVKMFQ